MSAPIAKDGTTQGSVVWGSKEIRALRKTITTYCSGCGKSEEELGGSRPLCKCAEYHSAMYCSKDCQKKDWPEHKETCGNETRISKLVKSLMMNLFLMKQLHTCFILAFELLDRVRTDEVLCAQLDVAIEPSDIVDFAHMLLGTDEGSSNGKKKIQGMLQLNAFTPDTTGRFTVEQKAAWRGERAFADANGFQAAPWRSWTSCMQMQSAPWQSTESVRRLKMEGVAVPGQTTRVPYTNETCLEAMNTIIRVDKDDKFLLYTRMRPADIRAIRDCPSISARNRPAALLHAKIARERIYRDIYEEFLQHRKAATGVIPAVPVVKGFKNIELEA
ncbi:hypothetical protein C8R45DRAFT_1157890 [Mycena sanguinolenta]|nr:hypothetical protein C8R45DRAFT_1157890 [Mycena sanguinolenta]